MAFVPGSAALASSEVELSISGRDLINKDLVSKSDPMCVTFIQEFGTTNWKEIHRTESILNNCNPDFASKVVLPYKFEEQQALKFVLYDIDSKSQSLKDHDFLGFATCTLAQIISAGKVRLQLQIKTDYGRIKGIESFVIISAEELLVNNDEVIFKFSGHGLDKKDWFGKSDPFLEIHKKTENAGYVVVHKTEVIKSTLNPKWKVFYIPVKTLCNGDYNRDLKFVCWDWNSSGNHSIIGEFEATLTNFQNGVKSFNLINKEKQKKKGSSYQHSGQITLENFEIRRLYSFMDYIKGGLQVHCTVAIDFTGSNGDPADPRSLHYISGTTPNFYEQAITSVVSIIQDYDTDKQFPALGFGARLPPDGRISHEFYVNMNPSNPYCNGVTGVLDAYRSCIRQVQLYGPTNFTPVIEHVSKFAKAYQDGLNYFILLILTDGVISDMPQTVKAIVAASGLPVSIIIIGIGNADFTAMETLDADKVTLQSGGVKAKRDIVQFVPFNKYLSNGDPRTARIRLAKEVLAEIPKQVVGYMRMNNFIAGTAKLNPVDLPPNPDLL